MTQDSRVSAELGILWIRLLALGVPEQTAWLLRYDLTVQQIRAFTFIWAHGQTSVTRVAEALGLKPSVATGIVQRLVDRRLVERHGDPHDRRTRVLSVTGRGRTLVDELSETLFAKAQHFLDRLSDEQLDQLSRILAAMNLQELS